MRFLTILTICSLGCSAHNPLQGASFVDDTDAHIQDMLIVADEGLPEDASNSDGARLIHPKDAEPRLWDADSPDVDTPDAAIDDAADAGEQRPDLAPMPVPDASHPDARPRDASPPPDPEPQPDAALPPLGVQNILLTEIDYDQDGPDLGEFIELFNPNPVPAEGITVILINGSTDEAYATYALGRIAANSVFVIGSQSVLDALPEGVGRMLLNEGQENGIQNGPDAVTFTDIFHLLVADGVAYEGNVQGGEGEAAPEDTGSAVSLSRCLNSSDTDDNASDFHLLPPSPGRFEDCQ